LEAGLDFYLEGENRERIKEGCPQSLLKTYWSSLMSNFRQTFNHSFHGMALIDGQNKLIKANKILPYIRLLPRLTICADRSEPYLHIG